MQDKKWIMLQEKKKKDTFVAENTKNRKERCSSG